jgi:hypothetical protein
MAGAVHFAAAIVALLCMGCATTLDVNVDERQELTGFCTWNFLPLWAGNVRAPHGNEPALGARLTRLVEQGLAERGFKRVTDTPDFFVTFYLDVRRQYVIVSETPATQYLNSMHHPVVSPSYDIQATQRRVEAWEIGRLTILVSDPDEQGVVWRGDLEGRYRDPIPSHLPEAVTSLLERFAAPIEAAGKAPGGADRVRPATAAECAPPA